ncbi:MAG: SH3-binding, glutamic acid-rich protein-domain-containing protein [Benniella sp.]|nr:MAG: SH3-binding, glutamic acid-rich protein-domain-containing protein [Benniella sp.]
MKRELEELSVVPELQRKPISSDVQDVLKEMEELRKQFNDAKAQHEKALEDLAAERALEVSQLKEAHEALLSTLTKEKDTLTESLEVLQETSELTVQEKDERIKELEEKIESSLQRHADAVSKHAEALESLRVEIEASLTKKHEAAVLELTRVHEERIKVLEEKASGSVKEAELQKLKDSMDEQIKELEDEQESRILELIAMHELDIQDLKDNLRNQADAHEELVAHMKQEHAEEIDRLLSEVKTAQSTKAELNQVRTELDDARKQLVSKDTELAELMKRIAELTKDLENASMSTLLKNTEKYKIKRVQIYGSSVSGNHKIKRAQQSISDTLERNEIEYEFVDISVSEDDKRYMRRKNGGELQLPQIFSDGEYRGVFEDFEYALETHQLLQFLAFDRVKPFVPRQKIGFGAIREGYAQDGEDAEQGAGLPTLVVNGMNDRPATTMGVLRPRRNTDMGTSKYLLSPGSKQFLPRSNGRSRGFVQAASQAWEGALREDITQVKHDLGIGAVIPDDDELDELFENGEVSEADLEAMVNSF